ncbi:hypothetical protein FALBO_8828 [Fusarium albosuccineum]|uniref:Uncharacterized protein n=1 Tax=Fusarium albosuccineum TaxID=1237068 RepID=A0A8H4PJA0_9HYPO|nr:hypothetical protein FALBO_8828 [Fusarium albosuccineum]
MLPPDSLVGHRRRLRRDEPRQRPQHLIPQAHGMGNDRPLAATVSAESGLDPAGRPPLQSFAQAVPFNMATRNAAFQAPASRRNIVFVLLYDILPQDDAFGAEGRRFTVDRDVLATYLPRTRYAVRRGTLDLGSFFLPEDMEPHPLYPIHQALHLIFFHLQEFSRTGVLDMFGAAEQQIQDDPVRADAVTQWAGMLHGICVVLDNGYGLGCSEGLLGHIFDFFEYLVGEVHNLIGWDETTILFEAFAGIFRTRRRELVDQLHRIWDRFDPEVQEQLLRDMRRALPVEGIDGKAHRMYRALGY